MKIKIKINAGIVKNVLIMVIFCVVFGCTNRQIKLNEDENKFFFIGEVILAKNNISKLSTETSNFFPDYILLSLL